MNTSDDLETRLRVAFTDGDDAEIARLSALMDAEDAERHARLAASDALASAAHWYGSKGIAVFPLKPRDKVPYLGSRGFKDATTDLAQIDQWWTARPDSNIGASTGLTFDVFDIDGEPGIHSLARILEQAELDGQVHPFEKCIGRSATSRDGGSHIFMPPTGRRGNAINVWPGIDHRGAGGYVVLPPSVGANGRRYTWLQPLEVSHG